MLWEVWENPSRITMLLGKLRSHLGFIVTLIKEFKNTLKRKQRTVVSEFKRKLKSKQTTNLYKCLQDGHRKEKWRTPCF